jgi:hypothetical protein
MRFRPIRCRVSAPRELVARIMSEADAILKDRLARMAA